MYIVVDQNEADLKGFNADFAKLGANCRSLNAAQFNSWLKNASEESLESVEGILIGPDSVRPDRLERIRKSTPAPIIALTERRELSATLDWLAAGADYVVCKPVHVREIMARADAARRHMRSATEPYCEGPLVLYFNGTDPEVDGEPLSLPRRERDVLEYLVRNAGRRISKSQLFRAVYGSMSDEINEELVEAHVSKLRKKLRARLGKDVIESKRYLGYRYIGL